MRARACTQQLFESRRYVYVLVCLSGNAERV
eukprot:COSAG02_NODE_3356_length_6878_cov_14.421596_1_plen_31_part_00